MSLHELHCAVPLGFHASVICVTHETMFSLVYDRHARDFRMYY